MKRKLLSLVLILSIVLSAFNLSTVVNAADDCKCALIFNENDIFLFDGYVDLRSCDETLTTKYVDGVMFRYYKNYGLSNIEAMTEVCNHWREFVIWNERDACDDICDCVKPRDLNGFLAAFRNFDMKDKDLIDLWTEYSGNIDSCRELETNKAGYGTYEITFTCKHGHKKTQVLTVFPALDEYCSDHQVRNRLAIRTFEDKHDYSFNAENEYRFRYCDIRYGGVQTTTDRAKTKCIGGRIGWIFPEYSDGIDGFEIDYVYHPEGVYSWTFPFSMIPYWQKERERPANSAKVVKHIEGTYKKVWISKAQWCTCHYKWDTRGSLSKSWKPHYEYIPCVNGKTSRFETGYTWAPWTFGKPGYPDSVIMRNYTTVNGKRLYSDNIIALFIIPFNTGYNYDYNYEDHHYNYEPSLVPFGFKTYGVRSYQYCPFAHTIWSNTLVDNWHNIGAPSFKKVGEKLVNEVRDYLKVYFVDITGADGPLGYGLLY